MHRVAALRHLIGGHAVGIGLCHHAGVVIAELNRNAFHRVAVRVADDHAVNPVAVGGHGLFFLRHGDFLPCQQRSDNLLILIGCRQVGRCAFHRGAENHALAVDKIGGRIGADVEACAHIVIRDEHRIIHTVFLHMLHADLERLFILTVDQNADDGAVALRQAFVGLHQLRKLAHAGAAPGCPAVDHGDLMLCKEILGGYGVSFRIRGLEAGGLSHRLSPEYGRCIEFCPGKHFGESVLQGMELLRILSLPFLDQFIPYEVPCGAVGSADLQKILRIGQPEHVAEILHRDAVAESDEISQIVLSGLEEFNLLFGRFSRFHDPFEILFRHGEVEEFSYEHAVCDLTHHIRVENTLQAVK